jgi:ribosomal protein S18 acetylase RimI-like enzyme
MVLRHSPIGLAATPARMGVTVKVRTLEREDADVCEAIVRGLPDWFGIEEGIAEARGYLETQDGLVADDGRAVVGFLTYTSAYAESMEITWMAVAADAHRRGIGRALIEALVRDARSRGCELVLVKTLADSEPSPEYEATRSFYRAMGFRPLTVLPDLWDAANPCLLMVRSLVSPASG